MTNISRYLKLFTALVCATMLSAVAFAQQDDNALPQKQTHLYAVKGADSLYLDHYVSRIEGKRPCVIFIFGGGFVGGVRDKEDDIPYFHFLTKHGYDVVSIDYRLGMKGVQSPGIIEFLQRFKTTIDIAVEDLFSATNYILENADKWQIDKEKIVVSGSSAGAITSLQAEYAICNSLPVTRELKEGFNYAGVMAFAGAIFTLDGVPRWNTCSAPTLLFHGSSDTQVPYNKMALFGMGMYGSKYIADKLHDAGMPYWLYSVEYETHSMAGKPMHENHYEILTFLDEWVMRQRPLQRTTYTADKNLPKRKTWFLPTDFINSNY